MCATVFWQVYYFFDFLLKSILSFSVSHTLLQHYCLIWLSIITSPRGWQLDFWLCILVIMDCLPILISISYSIYFCFFMQREEFQNRNPDLMIWQLTSFMRQWSPAYQLNNYIMHYVDGCVIKHIYILFLITMSITQVHRFIVTNLYCTTRLTWNTFYLRIQYCLLVTLL